MTPTIFQIISATTSVTDLLGTNPVRFFPWDQAPEKSGKPYATYTYQGLPENTMDKVPQIDDFDTQVDVWAQTGAECLNVAIAIRDVVEPLAHMTSFGQALREPGTELYRLRMNFDIFTPRPSNDS